MYDIVGGNICYESKYALVKDGKKTDAELSLLLRK